MQNKFSQNLLALGCALSLTGSAFGAKTGFYGGATVGWSTVHVASEDISGSNGSVLAQAKKKPSAVLGGGILGWGLKSGCLYGGIEMDGFYSDISENIIVDKTSTLRESFHIKNTYQVGTGARFGYVHPLNACTWVMPFLRMGIQFGKYQRKYTAQDPDIPGTVTFKKNTTKLTTVLGGGAELLFKDKYSIRVEGRYSPRFTQRLLVGAVPNVVAKFESSRFYLSASERSVMVSALYYI